MKKFIPVLLVLAAVTVGLAGCGIKPSGVKPPENATKVYPGLYPNPETLDAQGPVVQPVQENPTR